MTDTPTLRVAGAQLACALGHRQDNLDRAADLAARAVADGARLVLFPELMPSGYSVSPELWRAAEPPDGPTARWLSRTSKALGVHLGTSFAEVAGGDVYNTFVLTGPDGAELGRVSKTHTETYLFRGRGGPHVIDTPLGRVGVGICADNLYADFARLMWHARIDLLLMPHHAPAACRVGGLVSRDDVRAQHDYLKDLAPRYAALLGVPAVFANGCGPTAGRRGVGLIGAVVNGPAFHFPGLTTVADAGGRVAARLGDEEGVAIADVTPGPGRRPAREPEGYPGGLMTRHSLAQRALYAVDGALGRLYYARGHHLAGQVTSGAGQVTPEPR